MHTKSVALPNPATKHPMQTLVNSLHYILGNLYSVQTFTVV